MSELDAICKEAVEWRRAIPVGSHALPFGVRYWIKLAEQRLPKSA